MSAPEATEDEEPFEVPDVLAPLPKYELVLRRCPSPRAIAISCATQRGIEWLQKCKCYAVTNLMCNHETKLPASVTFCVHECYDFEEVLTFMASPEWVWLDPVRPEPYRPSSLSSWQSWIP